MINFLKKVFLKTEMTYKKVILLSVSLGVIIGFIMVPPIFKNTSFAQPGISFEFWVFMALFIVLNCKKALEAGFKTFLFFLIGQPLIYLVQVPFSSMGFGIFSYYPRWFIITLLTFPGGMLAFLVKKGNLLSLAVLSLANLLLCYEMPSFFFPLINNFPRYLITVVFILFEIILFTLVTLKRKKLRVAAFVIAAVFMVLSFVYAASFNKSKTFKTTLNGTAPFTVTNSYDDCEIKTDGNTLSVTVKSYNSFPIDIVDASGNKFTVEFSYGEKGESFKQSEENT